MKPSTKQYDLKDDDIRALLDAKAPVSSPPDLDLAILSAAKAAVQTQDTETSTSSSPVTRYGSWLAVAAVVVLAIVLVPVLQQSDETDRLSEPLDMSLNDKVAPVTTFKETDVRAADAEQTIAYSNTAQSPGVEASDDVENGGQSIADTAASLVAEIEPVTAGRTRGEEVHALKQKRESGAANLPLTENSDAGVSKVDVSDIDAMTDLEIRQTFELHRYRRDRQTWQAEITRLKALKQTVQVVREQRLFERMYPGNR